MLFTKNCCPWGVKVLIDYRKIDLENSERMKGCKLWAVRVFWIIGIAKNRIGFVRVIAGVKGLPEQNEFNKFVISSTRTFHLLCRLSRFDFYSRTGLAISGCVGGPRL